MFYFFLAALLLVLLPLSISYAEEVSIIVFGRVINSGRVPLNEGRVVLKFYRTEYSTGTNVAESITKFDGSYAIRTRFDTGHLEGARFGVSYVPAMFSTFDVYVDYEPGVYVYNMEDINSTGGGPPIAFIEGQVVDTRGKPLEKVRVQIMRPTRLPSIDRRVLGSTTTINGGLYRICVYLPSGFGLGDPLTVKAIQTDSAGSMHEIGRNTVNYSPSGDYLEFDYTRVNIVATPIIRVEIAK